MNHLHSENTNLCRVSTGSSLARPEHHSLCPPLPPFPDLMKGLYTLFIHACNVAYISRTLLETPELSK